MYVGVQSCVTVCVCERRGDRTVAGDRPAAYTGVRPSMDVGRDVCYSPSIDPGPTEAYKLLLVPCAPVCARSNGSTSG